MRTSIVSRPHGDLTWQKCIFLQHYSPPSLEFDSDLGRAQELLFGRGIHFASFKTPPWEEEKALAS